MDTNPTPKSTPSFHSSFKVALRAGLVSIGLEDTILSKIVPDLLPLISSFCGACKFTGTPSFFHISDSSRQASAPGKLQT